MREIVASLSDDTTFNDAIVHAIVAYVVGLRASEQEAQLSPRDRMMRCVSWNLANCHATVQKLLVRQVLMANQFKPVYL